VLSGRHVLAFAGMAFMWNLGVLGSVCGKLNAEIIFRYKLDAAFQQNLWFIDLLLACLSGTVTERILRHDSCRKAQPLARTVMTKCGRS
jgi:hypothetical protein